MTITQRIELWKMGYSREEINQMAEEEKNPPQPDPEPVPAPQPEPEPAPAPAPQPEPDPVLLAIKELTAALQQQNIKDVEQPNPQPPESAANIYDNLLKG